MKSRLALSTSPETAPGKSEAQFPRNTEVGPPIAGVGRLGLRLDEIASTLGISRRTLERERSAGRFPKPDKLIGRMPIWLPATIERWMEGGGR